MISKELLSEVLQKEAERGSKSILGESYLEYKIVLPSGGKLIRDINIYELAHKCKEWAHIKGYSIITMSDFDLRHNDAIDYHEYSFTDYINMNLFPMLNKKDYTHLHDVSDKTEPESIFKACQWILENKGG